MAGDDEIEAALKPAIALGPDVPPVRRVPVALARRFAQICMTVSAADVGPLGLTPLEFAVIAYLHRPDGNEELDQSGLGERIGIDRNNVSLMVDALEQRGLVRRRVDPDDRRARQVSLTREGRGLFEKMTPITYANQMRILDVLEPGEREVLLDLLVRVIEGNRALARPGAGRRKSGKSRKTAVQQRGE